MQATSRVDYATLGHVTVDVLADGTRRPGGTAFYAALQASRLGLRTQIHTRGAPAELNALLEPYRDELDVHIEPAPHSTTLATEGHGRARRQRLLAWAGALPASAAPDASIVHLAPVARELAPQWTGRTSFLALTPQGLARGWPVGGGDVIAADARGFEDVAASSRALVLSVNERASCATLIAAARDAGGVVAITDGPHPVTLLDAGGELAAAVAAVTGEHDDIGAGDVFAAAFFIALADGCAPPDAAAYANAAAAVRLEGDGPEAIGRRDAIEERMRPARDGAL